MNEKIIKRLANLMSVKSLVTLTLTAVFAYLAVRGEIAQDFMTIYAVIIAFYFGHPESEDSGRHREGDGGPGMNGAIVKVYSKAKDGGTALSAHFKVREFACHDGTDTVFISSELVGILEKIRVHFGKPGDNQQRLPHRSLEQKAGRRGILSAQVRHCGRHLHQWRYTQADCGIR